jgi:hypothetical protein
MNTQKGTLLYGLKPEAFEVLHPKTKKNLLTLMARISEASYRRGCQQAQVMEFAHDRVSDWRYGDLDKSPGFDARLVEFTALERLDIEYGGYLDQIGLRIPSKSLRIRWSRRKEAA